MLLPGYEVVGELSRGKAYVLHRGRRKPDGTPVLLKATARNPARLVETEGLRREFALLSSLDLPGVTRAHELLRRDAGCWLVLEDRGGVPLAQLLAGGPLELATVLHLALQLCSILAELHRRDVIHNDVQPGSILVHPETRELWLSSFSLASRGSGETVAPAPPSQLAGALAYLSPEQTGRMNRAIDHRTDLYSLGVTLYELLTGLPPFRSNDPLELLHAHLARSPVAPDALQPGIPEAVARIVMKLLEKTPEARYQSTQGLRADLEVCVREWNSRRGIAPFALGSRDVSDRLLIPQRLYGREQEVEALTRSFERVCTGPTSLLLVAGYSGAGKTSLIQELYRPVAQRRGHFVSGKFDQVARNVPYSALLQALRELVRQLLSESEERLEPWRRRLRDALGPNGGVLAAVIPEIELLLGEQPPPAPLPAAEAQNRFRLVFQDFVAALARKQHPLVVFLDDLQWADAASLALLQPLLTSPAIRFLHVIGTYRDNEVDAVHPLMRTLAGLETADARVEQIVLGPLGLAELTRFAGDCLRRQDAEIEALARLLVEKTGGNPLFVIQFLKTLWQEGLLRFDHGATRWHFRLDEIEQAPITHNVIELMSRKIDRLSEAAQLVLTLAACVGNPFDLETLAVVSEQSREETSASLQQALDEGLLLHTRSQQDEAPADDGLDRPAPRYAFLHDRVQQAAYARLPEQQRQRLHLTVGRLLLERWNAEARLFDIVGHLNLGRELIADAAERVSLAQLNLRAGARAKSSSAYEAALGHFGIGIALLPASTWSDDYALMFELQREAAECEYLCGRFEAAERRFEELLRRARTTLDRAQVFALRLVQYESQARYSAAAQMGREGLALLGVSFPADMEDQRAALETELEKIERLLAGRSIESLVELPVMSDAQMRMVMGLLTDYWAPAYITGGPLLIALVSARMVSLSIEHGNTEDSAYGYVTHAITVGPTRGDYASAYEWGELALRVNERFDDRKHRAKVHQQFNAHVTLWRRPLAGSIPHAREACRSGLENGDFTYAGYGAYTESWPAFLIGNDLERFVREFEPTLALLQRIRTTGLADCQRLMLSWARALQGRTQNPLSLTDPDLEPAFDETSYATTHHDNPFFLTVLHIVKLHLALHFEDPVAALAESRRAREQGWGRGTIWPVLLEFWTGLAVASIYAQASPDDQRAHWDELVSARSSLEALSRSCPENFRCYWLLLSAEIERIAERPHAALDLLEVATAYARQTDSLQHEALAQELSGRLWLARGNEAVATVYLDEARRCYRQWGAAAKVRQLEQRHPRLRLGASADGPSLDLASVLKAAHALAGEIVLEELLRKLMRIMLENAGAERGMFLEERAGQLVVAAEASVEHEAVSPAESAPLESTTRLSQAVVQYVRKTGESVVLGDAVADKRFVHDPYMLSARPRSLLCLPLLHQGKLGGILYLENNLAADVFTAERLAVLDVLASQAAISLENARLYRERTNEVERRTQAEEALRSALAEVEVLKNRLEAENVYLQEEIRREHNFEKMVGNSPALLQLLHSTERIAPTDSTVLIQGETGTGKELIARAIHDRSLRKERPLVKVNCGAIAAGLVESELFGHVKGAFTGALDNRVGRFELAQGGTIFLDEIGELALETQVKLLRVLQEQEFEPVGSSRTRRVDVRVIAATNRDLATAVRAGRFRSDLFYRLNVLPLTVPPLRERRSDIPLLVFFFLQRFSRRFGKPVPTVGRRTLELLVNYPWPGNVRELQNVIERAVVLNQGPQLMLDDDLLPAAASSAVEIAPATAPPQPIASPPALAELSLQDVERRHILETLRQTRGVIDGPSGAARILGLHPNTLRSRMKKLEIRRPFHEMS